MPLPFPFTVYGANRSSNTPSEVTCDFTYCYGGDWVQGKVGNYGIHFDGVNDYINVPVSDAVQLDGELEDGFTVACWFSSSATSFPDYTALANKSNSTSWANGWGLSNRTFQPNTLEFWVNTYTNSPAQATGITHGVWNHIAGVWDGTNNKIYLNGELQDSNTPVAYTNNSTANLNIGRGQNDAYNFEGGMDEFAIWNTPLTPAQISLLSTGSARADSFTPPELISDSGSWVSGKLDDYSLQFGGGPTGARVSDDVVEIPYTSSMEFTTQDFSIGCWVKVHPTETYQGIVSNMTAVGGWQGWVLGTVAAGQFAFSPRNPALVPNAVYTYSAIQSNVDTEWHHVVGVRDGIYNRLYVNGTASAAPSTMASIAWPGGSLPYLLGQWYDEHTTLYSGLCDLDEVGLWNVALDPGAIDELYNSGDGVLSNTVSSSNMVAYYNMESGPGNGTLIDRTGNGNNGTLTDMNDGTATTGSLLLYYDFEIGDNNPVSGNFPGNTTVYDVVTASFHPSTAHTGTMTNMSVADFGVWGQGKLGKYSFSSDGTDDYIEIASSSYLPLGDGNESFSVSFWANTSGSTTSYETVIGRHDSFASADIWRDGFNIQYNHGQSQTMRFSVGSYYDTGDQAYKTWSTAANTTFRHVVATYNTDTDVSQLWIDGVKGTDGTKAGGTYGANPGTGIVQILGLGTNADYAWPGNIDEVSFWNGVLDTGSIDSLASGSKANAITASAGSATPGDWLSPGKDGTGYALHMPGGSGYIGVNNKSDLGPEDGTVAFWAKINWTGRIGVLAAASKIAGGGSSVQTSWLIYRHTNGNLYVEGGNGIASYWYMGESISDAFAVGWNHYAFTWDSPIANGSTSAKFYINGDDTGNTAITSLGGVTVGAGISGQEVTLGDGWRGDYTAATGSMDEFGVWDTPLSAADIASLHGGTLCNAISSSNLILYYDFEGGPGNSTIVDRSTAGNDHSGDFNNMSAGSPGPAAATLSAYLDMECDGPGSANVLDLSGNSLSGTLINADTGSCGAG